MHRFKEKNKETTKKHSTSTETIIFWLNLVRKLALDLILWLKIANISKTQRITSLPLPRYLGPSWQPNIPEQVNKPTNW